MSTLEQRVTDLEALCLELGQRIAKLEPNPDAEYWQAEAEERAKKRREAAQRRADDHLDSMAARIAALERGRT